jgi:hypothetical protein
MSKPKLSAADVKRELWNRGELKYKLKGKQIDVYQTFKEASDDINVICCSRRFGKSFILFLLSVETCLSKPGAVVKYACPTQKQVKEIIRKIARPALSDCPAHLKPEWKEADKMYVFPNGSEIQIAATDNGNIENLRGGAADLCIVDEAGFATDLIYCVDNVLAPTTDTTDGKVILASTPNPKNPNHEFNVEYVLPRQNAGTLLKFTIYDSPMISDERREKIIKRYGLDNPRFRCEYLCEVAVDPEALVIGEFTPEKENEIVVEWKRPPLYDAYSSMDIGFRDLTSVLFAYYDYLNATLVIEDEYAIRGVDLTTDKLAESIKEFEAKTFQDDRGLPIQPTLRIADNNNLILLNDLYRLHQLAFIATKKDNKEAQINELKMLIKQNKIVINPRCKTLLYHLRAARWNKKRNDFERLKDIKEDDGTIIYGGHADFCFLPKSTVYTATGIKNICDVVEGDLVLTHTGKYKKVLATSERFYKGPCLDIQISGRENIKCTPNHKFLAGMTYKDRVGDKTGQLGIGELDWVEASNLIENKSHTNSHRVLSPKIDNSDLQKIDISKEMSFLYGYYVAEGSLSGNKSTIQFAGHIRENNVMSILEKAVVDKYGHGTGVSRRSKRRHKLGVCSPKTRKCRWYHVEGFSRVIKISCIELWRELRNLSKSTDKKFPQFLSSLNDEQTLFMLCGYLFGDGHFSKTGIKSNSISKSITYQVEQMALKLGLSGRVRFHNKEKWGCKGQYIWELDKTDSKLLMNMISNYPELLYVFEDKNIHPIESKVTRSLSSNYKKIQKKTEFDYEGYVYTLQVEDDNSYNINGVAVKNCDSLIYLVRNFIRTKNPYPSNYFSLKGAGVFDPMGRKNDSAFQGVMNKIMGIVSKK